MTDHRRTDDAADGRQARCQSGGNSLGQAPAAMSEVQICGIPKLSALEVALTP